VNITDRIVLVILFLGVAGRIGFRKLSKAGAITGGCLALLLYVGIGLPGLIMLATFFIAGTVATAAGRPEKEKLGIAEKNKGERTTGQVLANGGVAALAGLLAIIKHKHPVIWQLAAAAALSSATADTLSSELGSIFGRRFYNILTFKKEAKGLDGVISLEGTLLGAAGAGILALLYGISFGMDESVWFVVIAGIAGNLADSLLGATLERKHIIGNDTVNLGNTLFGAITAMLLYLL